jgi:hypothetical protein
MATKGRLTQGASLAGIESRLYGRQETFTAGDEITELLPHVQVDTAAHNMRAAIYDTSGARLALGPETSIPVGAGQVSLPISYTVGATTDLVLAICSENTSGGAALYYDAGSGTAYYDADASNFYPPATTWAGIGSDGVSHDASIAATYTPAAAGVEGDLAVSESGADLLAADGFSASTGVRLTLRDTDTGALAASLTNLIVSIRAASNAGSMLASVTNGATDAGGVLDFPSNAIGSIGDYVYTTVEKADNSVVATYRVQVIDLNA